jgi:hypothetical protein
MNRKRVVTIVAVLVLFGLLFFLYAGHQTPAGQPPLADLQAHNFTAIENAFNEAKNDVRILLLLSPT